MTDKLLLQDIIESKLAYQLLIVMMEMNILIILPIN